MDFERTTKPASDVDIDLASDEIMAILKTFDSPKDAGSALTLAHYKMTVAAFPPGNRQEAVEAVETCLRGIVAMLNEGWH